MSEDRSNSLMRRSSSTSNSSDSDLEGLDLYALNERWKESNEPGALGIRAWTAISGKTGELS
jgi:hypothetical protein